MKNLSIYSGLCAIFIAVGLGAFTLLSTGCATTQTPTTSALQTLINDAWTAANNIQTSNGGKLITPEQQASALALTHNSGDAQYATVVTTLINQVLGAQIAAQAAKVNVQAATNVVLAPANVESVAISVANGTSAYIAPPKRAVNDMSICLSSPGAYAESYASEKESNE